MDWLEEKVEKLRGYIRNASLVKSLFFYLAAGVVAAVTLWVLTRNLCQSWMSVFIGNNAPLESGWLDEVSLSVAAAMAEAPLGFRVVWCIYRFSLYAYLVAAFGIAGWQFLKRKVRPALAAVKDSMLYIAAGDYGHEISYLAEDEMGELCQNFELLRKRLVEEKKNQWMNEETQRHINAAFAHDVRTPLTVMKGSTEFLQRYVPQGRVDETLLMEKLAVMAHQEERLLALSDTMSRLQQEEKRAVGGKWLDGKEFAESLKRMTEELASHAGKICETIWENMPATFFADRDLMEEVFDNLLTNALRYAKERIVVEIVCEEQLLRIYVRDDGSGFSVAALRYGTEAYFSEEKKADTHFGIGLSIGRKLCEKHGGKLSLVNSVEGGAVACASFLIGIR